jgi:hypothetical protein
VSEPSRERLGAVPVLRRQIAGRPRDDACSVSAVSAENRADTTAIAVGIGLALAISLVSGLWVVGVVIGIAVGAALADKLRLRAGLPQRRLLTPRGRDQRKR